jgi:hypothetical protein
MITTGLPFTISMTTGRIQHHPPFTGKARSLSDYEPVANRFSISS